MMCPYRWPQVTGQGAGGRSYDSNDENKEQPTKVATMMKMIMVAL